jgi:hypothetical protein
MAVYCEGGRLTRRRPIGRDYAAAKDAECESRKVEMGMRNGKELGSGKQEGLKRERNYRETRYLQICLDSIVKPAGEI